eukprot:s1333_g22.t1
MSLSSSLLSQLFLRRSTKLGAKPKAAPIEEVKSSDSDDSPVTPTAVDLVRDLKVALRPSNLQMLHLKQGGLHEQLMTPKPHTYFGSPWSVGVPYGPRAVVERFKQLPQAHHYSPRGKEKKLLSFGQLLEMSARWRRARAQRLAAQVFPAWRQQVIPAWRPLSVIRIPAWGALLGKQQLKQQQLKHQQLRAGTRLQHLPWWIQNLPLRAWRVDIQIACFGGTYHKFNKIWEKTYKSIHYLAFVNQTQGAGVVVCAPAPEKVRYLGIKVLSSSKIEVTAMLTGGWYGDIELQDKSVFDVLVECLEMHDLQHPEHKETFVTAAWNHKNIVEEDWRREAAVFFGVKSEPKPEPRAKGRSKGEAAPLKKPAAKAKTKAKAKAKSSHKGVMKKPSKGS